MKAREIVVYTTDGREWISNPYTEEDLAKEGTTEVEVMEIMQLTLMSDAKKAHLDLRYDNQRVFFNPANVTAVEFRDATAF